MSSRAERADDAGRCLADIVRGIPAAFPSIDLTRVRVLDILPVSDSHRATYVADFLAMAKSLIAVQRSDRLHAVDR